MKASLLTVGLMATVFGDSAMASAGMDLAKEKNCLSCHAEDHKVVGPAYKDIAEKYAGQKGAEDKLVKKVIAGGSGIWGSSPMPPNTHVSQAEAHTLVHWILSLK